MSQDLFVRCSFELCCFPVWLCWLCGGAPRQLTRLTVGILQMKVSDCFRVCSWKFKKTASCPNLHGPFLFVEFGGWWNFWFNESYFYVYCFPPNPLDCRVDSSETHEKHTVTLLFFTKQPIWGEWFHCVPFHEKKEGGGKLFRALECRFRFRTRGSWWRWSRTGMWTSWGMWLPSLVDMMIQWM